MEVSPAIDQMMNDPVRLGGEWDEMHRAEVELLNRLDQPSIASPAARAGTLIGMWANLRGRAGVLALTRGRQSILNTEELAALIIEAFQAAGGELNRRVPNGE